MRWRQVTAPTLRAGRRNKDARLKHVVPRQTVGQRGVTMVQSIIVQTLQVTASITFIQLQGWNVTENKCFVPVPRKIVQVSLFYFCICFYLLPTNVHKYRYFLILEKICWFLFLFRHKVWLKSWFIYYSYFNHEGTIANPKPLTLTLSPKPLTPNPNP